MKKFNRLAIGCCFLTSVAFAQEQEPSLNSGTIDSQFEYIHSVSNNFQEYKVVKKTNLDKIQKNITDSLNVYKHQIVDIKGELAAQSAKIEELEKNMALAEAEKNEALSNMDSIEVSGVPIEKSTFTNLMGGIIGFLSLAMLFILFKFQKNNKITRETLQTLAETQEEFDQHRKNTLERERKLNRQLVDEMNRKVKV